MVRDRRRILGLKVKCPFDDCGEQMELRQLRGHQKNCQHKPDDWVDPREGEEPAEEPMTPLKAQDEKQEPAAKAEEPEFVIEMDPEPHEVKPDGQADQKVAAAAANANNLKQNADQEEKDRLFALQMQQQEQARARNLSRQPSPVQKRSVAVQPVVQPVVVVHQQALELAPADDGQYFAYQAADGRKEGEGVGAGIDGGEILRPPKKTRCCNDKIWCCFCCVFWIVLLVIGAFILIKGGVDGAKESLGV
jgi:hypothetical protein